MAARSRLPIVTSEFLFGGQPVIDVVAIPPAVRLVAKRAIPFRDGRSRPPVYLVIIRSPVRVAVSKNRWHGCIRPGGSSLADAQ